MDISTKRNVVHQYKPRERARAHSFLVKVIQKTKQDWHPLMASLLQEEEEQQQPNKTGNVRIPWQWGAFPAVTVAVQEQ